MLSIQAKKCTACHNIGLRLIYIYEFLLNTAKNLGIDFKMKTFEMDEKKIKLQIW